MQTGNPNGSGNNSNTTLKWPTWSQGKQIVNFQAAQNTLITDDFREDQYEVIRGMASSLLI